MSINKLDARHRIKRSNLTGVVPTVPASLTDFTDGTWLNTDIRPGEFFYNIPDMKLWIGTNSAPFELTGSFALPLANVLLNGNTSGASDIIMDTMQVIKSGNGGGQISLDDSGNPGEISLTTDNGGYGESYLYMYPLGTELKSNTYGIGIDSTKTTMSGNTIAFESGTPSAGIGALSAGAYKINISGDYILSTMCNTTNSNTIVIKNTASAFSSDNNDMNASIISSKNSSIAAGAYNNAIVGGSGNSITAGAYNLITGFSNDNITGNSNILCGNNNDNIGSFSILCGTNNVNVVTSSILCGTSNSMLNRGIMYGSASYSSSGMATHGIQTTNATPTILTSNGIINGLQLHDNSALRADIVVIARDSSGNAKEWTAKVLVKQLAGTMSIVGSITFTSTLGDAALAAATVSATTNSTDKSLEITVTGLAATTISWGADIKYIYVS